MKTIITKFRVIKIKNAGRDLNACVNALASLAMVFEGETILTIIVDLISNPNHEVSQELFLVKTKLEPSWMD